MIVGPFSTVPRLGVGKKSPVLVFFVKQQSSVTECVTNNCVEVERVTLIIPSVSKYVNE